MLYFVCPFVLSLVAGYISPFRPVGDGVRQMWSDLCMTGNQYLLIKRTASVRQSWIG